MRRPRMAVAMRKCESGYTEPLHREARVIRSGWYPRLTAPIRSEPALPFQHGFPPNSAIVTWKLVS